MIGGSVEDDDAQGREACASQMWKQEYRRKGKAVMEGSGRNSEDSGKADHGKDFNCPLTSSNQKTRDVEIAENILQSDVDSLVVIMEMSNLIQKISGDNAMIGPKGRNNLVEIPVTTIIEGPTNSKIQGSWKRLNKEGSIRHGIKEQEVIKLSKKRKKGLYGLNGSKKHCELDHSVT